MFIRILSLLAVLGAATASFDSAMLEIHNFYRQNETNKEGAKNMVDLTFSQAMKDKAQAWANGCVWKHSPRATPWIGENLAMSYPANPDLEAEANSSVTRWYNEKYDYDYDSNKASKKGKQVGHYTQVVWAKSTEVGCGYKLCTRDNPTGSEEPWNYVVCNYSPGGNFNGEKPYEKGSTGGNQGNNGGNQGNNGGNQGNNGGNQGNNGGNQGNNGGDQGNNVDNQGNNGANTGTTKKPCPNCSDGTCASCKGNKPTPNGRRMAFYYSFMAMYLQRLKDKLPQMKGDKLSTSGKCAVRYVGGINRYLGSMLESMKKM